MDKYISAQMAAQPLSPTQEYCKNFIINTPRCGLFVPMGVGKTRITLEALLDIDPHGHVLVIAPKTIARSVWQDEIEKWDMPFRTKSLIVNERGNDYSAKKRHKLYQETLTEMPTIYYINRELISDLVNHLPMQNGNLVWPFPVVIIDELQSFKSYKATRFKALQKVQPCFQRFIGLTGTPTPKGLMDLWPEIYLMDGGVRLGPNITAYRNAFFRPGLICNGYPVEWIPLYGAENEIHQRIKDIVISTQNSHLKLPPLTVQDIYAHMTKDEMEDYRRFAKTAIFETTDGKVIEAVNAGVLQAKLSQMASGAMYKEKGSHEYEMIHEHKLELCDYIINNTASPVLIAYHFQSDCDMLMNYLTRQGHKPRVFDKTPKMIADWNNGNVPIMLLQPASAGFGLNLQQGGHTLIWYTVPWSLEEYEQTNARLYRQGQKNPVTIYHLLTKNTIDERIPAALKVKDMSQTALMNAVQAVINSICNDDDDNK